MNTIDPPVTVEPTKKDPALVEITADFSKKADEIISRYPVSKRSASMPLLHLWQETYDFISDQGIRWIADKLELQPINIMELVTFYPMYRQHPTGKHQVKVCRTLSCALGGSYALCEHIKKQCGVTEEDAHGAGISPDKKYSIEFVECLASCGTAPVMMIDDDFYEGVTPDRADELLKKYQ